jgi:hypothetical protein
MGLRATFDGLVGELAPACRSVYGDRVVSVAVFGSVARGTMRPDSDIDVLVIADPLPAGRVPRIREFDAVDAALGPSLQRAEQAGFPTRISAVIRTPAEIEHGTSLLLDMTREVRILEDRDGFFRGRLDRLAARLRELGSRRIRAKGGYYWLLKPDLGVGEDFEL